MHTRFTMPERLKDLRVAEKNPPPMLVEDKTFDPTIYIPHIGQRKTYNPTIYTCRSVVNFLY